MKEKDFRVIGLLKSIDAQDYPKDNIELIITDGGSNPDVLEECRKFPWVKIHYNPKMLAEGAGMGKDQGIWHSTGEFIVIAESDIELMDPSWIRNMLKPFKDKEVFAACPRLYIHPKDSPTNKYLSYVGVDPFASYRSLEGQIELDEALHARTNRGEFHIIELNPEKPYCMGSNGFMFRKQLTEEVGDYAQDVEFIARLSKHGYRKFAVVNDAKVWHKNVNGFVDFLKKRIKWTRNYSKIYVHEKKDFNWINDRKAFFWYVVRNMVVFPNVYISIRRSLEYKDASWLMHAPMMFISTSINIYFTLFSRKMLTQVLKK